MSTVRRPAALRLVPPRESESWYDEPRMYPSLAEQRRRGIEGRNEFLHPTSWFGRRVTRRISPYVTWAFLRLGVSANQCTLLRLILTVGVAAMFGMGGVVWWLAALLVRYVTVVLDCVDDELARLRGTSSPEGTYFDDFVCQVAGPVIVCGMACGLFRDIGGLHVVAIGLAATVGITLTVVQLPLARSVAYEWGLKPVSGGRRRSDLPRLVALGKSASQYLLMSPGLQFLPHALLAGILDAFVGPFALFGMPWNVRLLWMAFFATGTLSAAAVRCALTVRHGLHTQL